MVLTRQSYRDVSTIPLTYKFKDHAPHFFAGVRDLMGIQPEDYQVYKKFMKKFLEIFGIFCEFFGIFLFTFFIQEFTVSNGIIA